MARVLQAMAWGLPACVGAAQAAPLDGAGIGLVAAPAWLLALAACALCWHRGRSLRAEAGARQQADAACRQTRVRLDEAYQQLAAARRADEERLCLIGELHRLERELHASEQRFRCVVESARDVVYTLDLDGRLRYISPRWQEMLGRDPAALLGQSHAWLIHPDDQPVCQAFVERALLSRSRQCGVEYRIRHADGGWRWYRSDLVPVLDTAGRLSGLIGVGHDISEREQGDARLFHLAHFDALTDLPGRRLFDDRLSQALRLAERHGGRIALLHVDLDQFRDINARWGPVVGDLVLREVASRIQSSLRASDSVGRLGSDDFVVLLNAAGAEPGVLQVADRIRRALDQPVVACAHRITLSACIGVALCPDHGLEGAELSWQAERALRLAKADGHGGIKVFRPARLVDEGLEQAEILASVA